MVHIKIPESKKEKKKPESKIEKALVLSFLCAYHSMNRVCISLYE